MSNIEQLNSKHPLLEIPAHGTVPRERKHEKETLCPVCFHVVCTFLHHTQVCIQIGHKLVIKSKLHICQIGLGHKSQLHEAMYGQTGSEHLPNYTCISKLKIFRTLHVLTTTFLDAMNSRDAAGGRPFAASASALAWVSLLIWREIALNLKAWSRAHATQCRRPPVSIQCWWPPKSDQQTWKRRWMPWHLKNVIPDVWRITGTDMKTSLLRSNSPEMLI